ncbi:MAG: hypothetical protein HY927_06545 [Elusimicrobia bacterium]|nr:hypothetical protein [Elusimicrobiota bacterium]
MAGPSAVAPAPGKEASTGARAAAALNAGTAGRGRTGANDPAKPMEGTAGAKSEDPVRAMVTPGESTGATCTLAGL